MSTVPNGTTKTRCHYANTYHFAYSRILKMDPFYTMVDVRTNNGVSTSVLRLNRKHCNGVITTKRHSELIYMSGETPDVVEETEFCVSEYNQSTGRLDDPLRQAGDSLCTSWITWVNVSSFHLTILADPIKSKHQKPPDRPDIVARVWNQNLRALLHDLDEGKRGLPHAHILIILAEEDKPRTRDLINKLVSCEIPDEATNPELNETVMNCMMHGPCGSQNPNCVCMENGKYSKGYPKPLVEVTRANVDGYAEV
ncbi:Helitron helicase [Phytophthora megakarya]|uniref:Helitron helicase n=1 Tax=Phytophthora megakarya TaxID=4795 RepID=A0A225ULI3_9STRA|nr:Helitron helicase [Phytophthora megakarya]